MINVGHNVQEFLEYRQWDGQAYQAGKFIDLTSAHFQGSWNVFFFYPADFTFVCPTELGDLQDHYEELKGLGVNVYGVSTDTHFVHKAWADASDTIKKLEYPLIGDANHSLTDDVFDILDSNSGLAKRSTFVVDPDGIAVIIEQTADGIGRNADELVRKIKAAIYTRNNPNEACPAKWAEGAATLTPSLDLVGKI
jgi:peroxiredoxin (alkyl hydroperoxide reductase subunit C)